MVGDRKGVGNGLAGGIRICAQRGGKNFVLQEGKGGDRTQKVTIKSPPKMFYVGKKLFTFFSEERHF